jgi:hypothetical protein
VDTEAMRLLPPPHGIAGQAGRRRCWRVKGRGIAITPGLLFGIATPLPRSFGSLTAGRTNPTTGLRVQKKVSGQDAAMLDPCAEQYDRFYRS